MKSWYVAYECMHGVLISADYGNLRRELHPPESPAEILKVDVKELCAFFEIVNLDHHMPILCLRSSLDATLKDWSKKVREGAMCCGLVIVELVAGWHAHLFTCMIWVYFEHLHFQHTKMYFKKKVINISRHVLRFISFPVQDMLNPVIMQMK